MTNGGRINSKPWKPEPRSHGKWRLDCSTARDTGALSYIPYEELQRYSDVYMLEQMVNQKAMDTAEGNFRAEALVYMGYDIDSLPET